MEAPLVCACSIVEYGVKAEAKGDSSVPNSKRRKTFLLDFRFVWQYEKPTPVLISYAESLQTKMTGEFWHQDVEGIVESALNLVTRSQTVRCPTEEYICKIKIKH